MENLKWKLSKTLKTAMRQKDIDTFTLAKIAEETYAAAHADGDLDVRQEVFKVIDEYAPEVNLEILNAAARSSAASSRRLFLNYLPSLNCLQDPRQCQADWRRFEFVARSYDSRCKFSNFHSNQKSERNSKMRQFSQVFKFSPQI